MSGGRFDYCGTRIRDDLLLIAQDRDVVRRWPQLAERLAAIANSIAQIEREIDLELSGDRSLGMDDARYETRALLRLFR